MSRKKKGKNNDDFRLSLPQIEISDSVRKDIFGVVLLAFGVISLLSFLSPSGVLGSNIHRLTNVLFGYGYILFPVLLFVWGWRLVKSEDLFKSRSYMVGVLFILFSLLAFIHIVSGFTPDEMIAQGRAGKGGGLIGASVAWILVGLAGKWGGLVLNIAIFLVSVIFTFQVSFLEIYNFFKPPVITPANGKGDKSKTEKETAEPTEEKTGLIASLRNKIVPEKKAEEVEIPAAPAFSVRTMGAVKLPEDVAPEMPEKREEEKPSAKEKVEDIDEEEEVSISTYTQKVSNWKLPTADILSGADSEPTSGDIQANSNIIKRTLANFGIEVEMGEVNVGPTVTQYTLKPSIGVKLSRITALQNDLALALAARTLRIEAPIPGQSWVGLELPNQSVAMVTLKTILESPEFKSRKNNLSMILGRDVAGSAVISNIAKMPHLMVAGATGSGKTVCINTLITGLLFQNSPEELKFIMVDPKRVELTPYNDIPHLLTPVITDPEKAINALKWAVKEMENRYDLLSKFGCRNIESYNEAVKTRFKEQDPLYYIIIVIDEMADLMATHGREMEAVVVRLAQMARAIGIHLVLSTQRPSVEVITGLIKANVTTRIAFCVASQIDSRTILDASGAEKLLGNGDMLYLSSDANKPKRIQGVFISEDEVRNVVDFIKAQKEGEVEYKNEIVESKKFSSDPMAENSDVDDDLYNEALETVRDAGKASASLLQRRLKVGYARAARLLDIMEDKGAIGPNQGAKPREVYLEGASAPSEDEEETLE